MLTKLLTTYRYGYAFSGVGDIFIVLIFFNVLHCNFSAIDKLRNCVTAPDVLPLSLLTPVPRKGVSDKAHKRLGFKNLHKRVADAHLVPF